MKHQNFSTRNMLISMITFWNSKQIIASNFFPPSSLHYRHTDLLFIPWAGQVCSHLRAFALTIHSKCLSHIFAHSFLISFGSQFKCGHLLRETYSNYPKRGSFPSLTFSLSIALFYILHNRYHCLKSPCSIICLLICCLPLPLQNVSFVRSGTLSVLFMAVSSVLRSVPAHKRLSINICWATDWNSSAAAYGI